MKCPNCSAKIAPGTTECEFCGHRITSVTDFLAQNKIPSMPSVSVATSASPAPPLQPATVVMNNPPPEPAASQPPPSPSENPYQHQSQASYKSEIPNYMLWAVLSTVAATFFSMCTCCFMPLGLPSGIAAITFANKVNTLLGMGDVEGAKEASKKAKLWSWVTTALAIIFGVWFALSMILNYFAVTNGDKNIFDEIRSGMESNR
jgi:predicted secreted protein